MAERKKGAAVDAAPEAEPEPSTDTLGQVALPLGGEEFVLRPSRSAVAAIERQLGRSLFHLAEAAARGALTIDEQAVIAAEMMRAFGAANPSDPQADTYKAASTDRIADLIFEAGSPRISARLMVVLTGALNGGYTASGEAKPPEKTTP